MAAASSPPASAGSTGEETPASARTATPAEPSGFITTTIQLPLRTVQRNNRQRLVHTFATNLRGPAQPLSFAGAPLRAVIPIDITAGNVPVTFAALSYAGTVWLTVLSDPDQAPDAETLTAALRQELPGTPG